VTGDVQRMDGSLVSVGRESSVGTASRKELGSRGQLPRTSRRDSCTHVLEGAEGREHWRREWEKGEKMTEDDVKAWSAGRCAWKDIWRYIVKYSASCCGYREDFTSLVSISGRCLVHGSK
jgi:hypothetical protein